MAPVRENEECHFFWTQELLFKDDSKYGPILQYYVSFCTYFDICTRIFFPFLSKIKQLHGRYLLFVMLGVHCKYSVSVYI